jgi:elongation factor G
MYFANKEITEETIRETIKKTLNHNPLEACVVVGGSALKNRGIQPLLDAVVHYLPSPTEKEPVVGYDISTHQVRTRHPNRKEKLALFIFKNLHDKEKGVISYGRLYSGVLHGRAHLFNTTHDVPEKIMQLFRARANNYVPINEASCGDIVAIAGLKHTKTGDTLIDAKDTERIRLQDLKIPPPVFTAALEYESLRDKPALEDAFKTLMREDPSLVHRRAYDR